MARERRHIAPPACHSACRDEHGGACHRRLYLQQMMPTTIIARAFAAACSASFLLIFASILLASRMGPGQIWLVKVLFTSFRTMEIIHAVSDLEIRRFGDSFFRRLVALENQWKWDNGIEPLAHVLPSCGRCHRPATGECQRNVRGMNPLLDP